MSDVDRYRALMAFAADAILFGDPEGTIVEASASAVTLSGYSREELLGQPISLLFSVAELERAPLRYDLVKAGDAVITERLLTRKDGSTVSIEMHSKLLPDGGYHSFIRDISERHGQREERVRELRFNQALAALYVPLVTPDVTLEEVAVVVLKEARELTASPHGFVSSIDPLTGDNVGHTLTEMMADLCRVEGTQRRIAFPRGSDGSYPAIWGAALNTGRPFFTNDPSSHPATTGVPSGHIPLRRFLAAPALLGGEAVGMIALANCERDYTAVDLDLIERLAKAFALAVQKVRTKNALRDREFWLQQTQSAGRVGSYSFDPLHNVWESSAMFAEICGLDGDFPPTYEGWLSLLFEEDRSVISGLCQETLEGSSELWDRQYRIRRPRDRAVRWVHDRAALQRDADGRLRKVYGTITDVTEQKSFEEDLVRAREAAEAANRAKSDFLANMSHELRTPINGVIGMTSLLRRTELNERQRLYLDATETSAKSLLVLINDILDLSRIEAGRLELVPTLFLLRGSIKEVLAPLLSELESKSLELRLEIDDTLAELYLGDELRFRQILLNLLSNAVKFTDTGTVTLRVVPAAGEGVTVTVSDTGIGMSPELQEQIFRPFVQGENDLARRFGGSGLGLAITRHLVEKMGGRITLSSRPGQGSIFTVTFPAETLQPSFDESSPPVVAPLPPVSATAPKAILVAEDNFINSMFVSDLLEELGHTVTTAFDGQQALALWQEQPFDLILMDVQMPLVDGVAAVRTIRAAEAASGRHTPVIALTAYALRDDREKFLLAGFDGYLSKPFTPEDLSGLLRNHLTP